MALAKASSRLDPKNVITAVAIDKDKNSQFAVKWAVDNLVHGVSDLCILIHVRSQSLNPDDFGAAPQEGFAPTEEEKRKFFLPYRGFCARKGILTKEIILHDIDVPGALIDYCTNNLIGNIVVGASNRSAFTWRIRNADVPSSLLKVTPKTCAVYVISSKGKVQSSKPVSKPQTPKSAYNMPRQDSYNQLRNTQSANNMPRQESYQWRNPQAQSENLYNLVRRDSYPQGIQNNGSPERLHNEDTNRANIGSSHLQSESSEKIFSDRSTDGSFQTTSRCWARGGTQSGSLNFSGPSSSHSSDRYSENLSVASGGSSKCNSPNISMRRLKLEIQQQMDEYHSACKVVVSAKHKANEMHHEKEEDNADMQKTAMEAVQLQKRLEEIEFHKEKIVEMKAQYQALEKEEDNAEMQKTAMEAAQLQKRLEEIEFHKEKIVEMKAQYQALEKEKEMHEKSEMIKATNGWSIDLRYKRYDIEEIESATNYFSNENKIGEGGYGPVYKAKIDHTAVAIKVLRPDLSEGLKQFQQEIDVLSRIRHPNMVLLLGACPEYGCLIYEHMDNGSLEDRLFMKDNTRPLSWQTRFRIAAEIATALLFLHQTKPEPLVHRDLKPANILLDKNYVSKIADVGLARLVPPSVADSVTQYHMTAAAGTFYYIDPEYQQTGMLGVKSDLYSLGVMLLQIITGKVPVGVSHQVEQAIEKGTFKEILDPKVRDWPVEAALSLAKVALKCCELRKRDRPDLATAVLPELIRLQELGTEEEKKYPYFESNYNPLPPLGPQINVRSSLWRRLMGVTKRNIIGTTSRSTCGGKKLRKGIEKRSIEAGCWSFTGCNDPLSAEVERKRYKSFS